MPEHVSSPSQAPPQRDKLAWYRRTPLAVRIMISLSLGVLAGELLGNTRPLPDLYAAAGARLAFDSETVGELAQLVASHLEG